MSSTSLTYNVPVRPPPIDLNTLYTPHKLAAFIVNIPAKKNEYNFLIKDDTQINGNNNHPNFLNPNKTNTSLKPPKIKKRKKKLPKKHLIKKKKSKKLLIDSNKKQNIKYNRDIDNDNDDINNVYNPNDNSVGPHNNKNGQFTIMSTYNIHDNTSNNNNKKVYSKPKQHQLVNGNVNNNSNNSNNNNVPNSINIEPQIPQISRIPMNNSNSSAVIEQDKVYDINRQHSHHQHNNNSIGSPLSLLPNLGNLPSMPSASAFGINDDNPQPMQVKIPSLLSSDQSSYKIDNLTAPFTQQMSMSLPNVNQLSNQNIPSIGDVNYDQNASDYINNDINDNDDINTSLHISKSILSNDGSLFDLSDENDDNTNNVIHNAEPVPIPMAMQVPAPVPDVVEYFEDYSYDDNNIVNISDPDPDPDPYSDHSSSGTGTGTGTDSGSDYYYEDEKNVCIRIAKVLYENSWTGEMISSSTEFSRLEYNALLNVGGVSTDSFISSLVWKIIFYSQKKTEDELINENEKHIKFYWWDSNDIINIDWKWRKYNVIICKWISNEYQLFIDNDNTNYIEINFKQCQIKLEKDQAKKENEKKNKNKKKK